jgi:hypothetical protein
MLGAYLEDNLSPIEISEVESAIQEDENLEALANSDIDSEYNADIEPDSDDSFPEEFDLPLIPDDSFIELDLENPYNPEEDYEEYAAASAVDDGYTHDDSYNDDNVENTFEDDDTSFDSSDDNSDISYE